MPPLIAHFRNPHSYHRDYMSELPLFSHTPALLQWLQTRRRDNRQQTTQQQASQSPESSFTHTGVLPPSVLSVLSVQTRLWAELYEHGVLEADDVEYAQAWEADLRAMKKQQTT